MADAWHHRSDALSSVGSLVGIAGAQLGLPILDPIASLVICLFILKASYDIFMSAVRQLVDQSADPEVESAMAKTIRSQEGVLRLDLLRTRQFGSRLYVDVEIAADGNRPYSPPTPSPNRFTTRSRRNSPQSNIAWYTSIPSPRLEPSRSGQVPMEPDRFFYIVRFLGALFACLSDAAGTVVGQDTGGGIVHVAAFPLLVGIQKPAII